MTQQQRCDICGQPLHRHGDRTVRYWCAHCQQTLCDLQVRQNPFEEGLLHKEPFCPGVPEKK